MGINRFSQAVNPPSLYKGTSDELDILSHQVPYERASNLVNSVNEAGQNIFGINAPGKDGEILAQKSQEVQAAIKELAKFGLDKPEIQGRINNLISSMSNDPDVLGITQRVGSYQKELENKKAAEAKGERYISPIIDQGDEYYSSGVYKRDTRFNQSGWLDPNVEKMKTEALKNVKVVKKQTLVNGVYKETEEYDPEQLQAALSNVYNNPLVQKTMDYQFDRKYKDFDFATEGVNKVSSVFNEAEIQKENAYSVLQKSKKGSVEYQKALEDYSEAEGFINKYAPLLQNPGKFGEDLKRQYKQDEINSQIKNDIIGSQFSSESAIKESQFALNNQKYEQDKQLKLFEAQTELFEGLTQEEQEKVIKQGNFNGVNLANAATKIQENKRKNAEAANPNITQRSENLVGYVREGVVKTGKEKKDVETAVKQNIDAFKKSGFTNIKGIEKVTMDENGDYVVDFDRVSMNQLNLPIGVKNNIMGDEVKFTKEEMAKILEVGQGVRKVEELQDPIPKPTEQNYTNPNDTINF